ncbi:cytochrome P450 [Trametopsis cervina]|nr:cytochrome P450 [Trametopsis cervina]
MISITSPALYALVLAAVAFVIYRRITRLSIKYIKGPSGSFWLGNTREFFYQKNVGDLDFQYAKDYGLTWRMSGALGEDMLMTADPKAIQYIFHKSAYNFPKATEAHIDSKVMTGHSIAASDRHEHPRHRKVMNPAFAAPQLRAFFPFFRETGSKLCRMWKDQLFSEKPEGQVVHVNKWLARMTLDVIGQTAYQFDFGALENAKNEVAEAYDNMFSDSQMHPSVLTTLYRGTWRFIPKWASTLIEYTPTREYKRYRYTRHIIEKVSNVLVANAAEEAKAVEIEKGKRDVMSVLVRANMSENPSLQLSKYEMISEMSALTLAGHETTANTLTWLLWELSKAPQFQVKLREEVYAKRSEITEKLGEGADFRMEDLESMPFLQALLKEILRFHPIVYQLVRMPAKDDVLPLSEPITTANGDVINEVPVAKGQSIIVSICTYNRLKSIWGEDADQFNPMRFIEGRVENSVKVGVYGNLMTFSAGARGCIGWRFSLIEMQAIIVELIENFEFSLPKEDMEILRMPVGVMAPMIKGRQQEGVLMPLNVRPLKA